MAGPLTVIATCAALIIVEPDFGSTTSLVAISLAVVFASYIFIMPSVRIYSIPWVGMIIALLPALLFMYFRQHFSGAEESIASLERFNQLKDEFLQLEESARVGKKGMWVDDIVSKKCGM